MIPKKRAELVDGDKINATFVPIGQYHDDNLHIVIRKETGEDKSYRLNAKEITKILRNYQFVGIKKYKNTYLKVVLED
jgi:hypothetical protein